jgi:isochorismate hydrolase
MILGDRGGFGSLDESKAHASRMRRDPRMKETSMTNLSDRPNTALLVVDVQNDVMANAHNRDEVVAHIRDLVGRARVARVPVIWIQHSNDQMPPGSEGWEYVPDLQRRESEPLVHKKYGDSFEDTSLESELTQRRVGRLVVAGAQTDACIRATLHGAFTRGYDTVLVADAHTTDDFTEYGLPPADKVIAHTNMYWTWQDGPGRTASVVDAAAVDFHADEPAPS